MSLCALTLCCGVKIMRVARVENLEVLPAYLRKCLEYGDKPMLVDRYYGEAGAGSQQFMTFRTDVASEEGKIYGFILSFHMVDFVLALRAAAKRM